MVLLLSLSLFSLSLFFFFLSLLLPYFPLHPKLKQTNKQTKQNKTKTNQPTKKQKQKMEVCNTYWKIKHLSICCLWQWAVCHQSSTAVRCDAPYNNIWLHEPRGSVVKASSCSLLQQAFSSKYSAMGSRLDSCSVWKHRSCLNTIRQGKLAAKKTKRWWKGKLEWPLCLLLPLRSGLN